MKIDKLKTKKIRIKKWLVHNQEVLNILGIERRLSFPKGVVHKFIKYNRALSDERVKKIDDMIQELISNYKEET